MPQTKAEKATTPDTILDHVRSIVGAALATARVEIRGSLTCTAIANVLRRGDEYQRSAMANLVGDLCLDEFTDELVEILLRDTSPCVRHEAAYALGQIASPRVFDLLAELAADDMRIIVRHEATLALAGFRSPAAALRLAALKQDESRDIRDSAIVALQQLQHETATSTPPLRLHRAATKRT